MGSRYLTDLADVVRSTGLTVQEEPGWQSRARGSGGYGSGLPNHVMIHHTASGASSDGQPDVNYMCYSADARPVANLYLSRSGKVWVMAAGATNTNGSGSDPCGAVANDNMNASTIGIEAGNNGTGEPWPEAQQDAYLVLCGALVAHYGVLIDRIHSHAEWAPGRKIDPAGPSRWAGSGTWNEDAFRNDVAAGSGGPTPTPERKIKMYGLYFSPDTTSYWASDMMTARWLQTNDALQHYQAMLSVFGFNPNAGSNISTAQIQAGMLGQMVGPMPWDAPYYRDAAAWQVWEHEVQAAGWPVGAARQYLVDGRVSANTAAAYAQQAAEQTAPAGARVGEPEPAEMDPPEPPPKVEKMKAPKG